MPALLLRRFRTAAAVISLAFVLTACGSGIPAGSTGSAAGATNGVVDSLRVGYVSTGILGGAEGYAYRHGNFSADLKKGGINDVQLTPFPGGSQPVLQALVGGSIDVGFLGNTSFLTAKANGQDIVLLNETLVGLDLWVISRPGGPKTLRQLDNAKIAIPFGDIQERVGKEIEERAGLKHVQWVNVPPTGQADALANGAADAAVVIARGSWSRLLTRGYPVVTKVSQTFPDLVGASVTVTTPQFLRRHPGFADAYEKARANAVRLAQKQEDAYNTFQAEEFREGKVTAEEEAVYYPASRFQTKPFTEKGLTLLRKELNWLIDHGIAKSRFDLDKALATYKS